MNKQYGKYCPIWCDFKSGGNCTRREGCWLLEFVVPEEMKGGKNVE